jgi:protein-S-isoprenylcysteine O-methyltransferase Ste14
VNAKLGPIIGSIVFFGVAPGVVAGWVPYALTGWRLEEPLLGLWGGRPLGGILAAIGLAGLLDSFARFAIQGQGTPAPVAPTKRLIVSGLYRHVRNPMYVAVVSIILGQSLVLGSILLFGYATVVWLAFHIFVLVYEEPTLRHQFGESYRLYESQVRRWWPRLRPWRADARAGPNAA